LNSKKLGLKYELTIRIIIYENKSLLQKAIAELGQGETKAMLVNKSQLLQGLQKGNSVVLKSERYLYSKKAPL